MSQPNPFNIPEVGPESPVAMAQAINAALDALKSGHIGSSRPAYAERGTVWLLDSSSPSEIIAYLYDGTDDIELGTFDVSGNTFTPAGSGNAYTYNLASQAQAEAGTNNTTLMSPLRVAQAIAALSSNNVDQIARDGVATNAIMIAISNDLTSLGLTGTVGNRFLVDDFRSDSLNVKTGATYDAVNDWYSSLSSSTTGTFSESQTTTENIGGSFPYFGMKFTATSTGVVSQVQIQVTTVSVSDTAVFRLYTDSAGSPGTQIGSDSDAVSISTTGVKTFTFSSSDASITSSTDYWVVFVPNTPGSISISISACGLQAGFGSGRASSIAGISDGSNTSGEYRVEITEDSATNMTLEPNAATITAGAQDILGYFVYDPVDSVTLGTDLTTSFSIDGGVTDASATLTAVGNVGSTGKIIYRAQADVSGQSGTSLLYTVSSANNKLLRFTDCVGLIPIYN